MDHSINWAAKLTSRKFWLALAGFVTGVLTLCGTSAETAEKIAALLLSGASVVAYILGEGLADSAHGE